MLGSRAPSRLSPSLPSPPRRITRASAARFGVLPRVDIEDAVLPTNDNDDNARKRRRLDTKTAPQSVTTKKANVAVAPLNESPSAANSSPAPKAPKVLKRVRKPARKILDPVTGGEVAVSPPSDWSEVYDLVRQMRAPGGAAANAAVDTMGCERLADRAASPRDQRFHTLIALMLSSQTKDTVNAVAMLRLKTELPPCKPGAPPGLNLENVLGADPETLHELIRVVGFHNNKTKYIKQAAEILRDQWNGDVPDTITGLTSLPGVGPKMAYLCLSNAWDRTEGIGVDVHVHRITNLWGWHTTRTPEETRLALQAWLPRDRWREINGLLVGLGQAVCLPVGRRCGDCDLGLQGLCKAADRSKVAEGRRRQDQLKKVEAKMGKMGKMGKVEKPEKPEKPKEEKLKEEKLKEEEKDSDAILDTVNGAILGKIKKEES